MAPVGVGGAEGLAAPPAAARTGARQSGRLGGGGGEEAVVGLCGGGAEGVFGRQGGGGYRRRLGVGHVEEARNASGQGGAALGVYRGLVGQSRLAEVDVCVRERREDYARAGGNFGRHHSFILE